MIQNVIFDLGNVLLRFRPDKLIMDMYGDETVKKALMKAVFKAPEWKLMDNGTMTEAEATEAFVKHDQDHESQIREIMKNWTKAITPIEDHIDIVEDMKKRGLKCYILSNFPKDAFEKQRDRHDFFKQFDGGVVSAYVHQLKPDDNIYESLMSKYDLRPETCLFLDDMKENIEAAKRLGMYGIQVTAEIDLKAEVNTYLEEK